jgi:hypothetical protein
MTLMMDFVKKHKIKMTWEKVEENPWIVADKNWKANHYQILLRCGNRRATFYFSQGVGVRDHPKIEEVLESLLMDCWRARESFSNFYSETDIDYSSAKRVYACMKEVARRMSRLLTTPEVYKEFREVVP